MKKLYLVFCVIALLFAGRAINNPAGASSVSDSEFTGIVRQVHGDNFAAKQAKDEHYILDSGKITYDLELPAGSKVDLGQKVKLRGHTEGKKLVVAQGGVASISTSLSSGAISGTQTVAVLLFNFTNDASQPWTPDAARGVVFNNSNSVKAYYQSSSDNQLSLTGNVFGWYSIPMDNSNCSYVNWQDAANSAATAAGVDLSAYNYIVYAHPYTSSCPWSGLGYLPGNYSWINGSMTLQSVAHELGHNFGVHHAGAKSCFDSTGLPVALSANCTSWEYGDPFSVMGYSANNLHLNWHREQLGWLSSQAITSSGQYILAPLESTNPNRLLSVARGDGTYFQLEFRQPSGVFDNFSSYDPVVKGISVRLAPGPSTVTQSYLLDMTPQTDDFSDSSLVVGRTFTDSANGISITTQATSASGATVSVQFGGSGGGTDIQAPTAPSNLSAKLSANKKSVSLSWNASVDNIGVTGYKIYRNGVQIKQLTTTAFTDTPTKGTWTYTVVAYDAAGNVSPLSNAATVKL